MTMLTAIVVTYRSAGHLPGLLDSVPAAAGDLSLRVLVVDNGSTDDSVAVARRYPFVEAIETGANLGYAGGINVGLAHLPPETDVVAILNPDLRLTPGSLRVLADAVADPAVGVAVPRIMGTDGSLSLSLFREPTIRGALGDALLGARYPHRAAWLTQTVRDEAAYERPGTADWASGAAWVLRASVLRELGPWDESYFLYSEETEYARRIRSAGYRFAYRPDAVVEHDEHGSGVSVGLAVLLALNKIRDFESHRGPVASCLYLLVAFVHHLLRLWKPDSRQVLALLPRRREWPGYVRSLQAAGGGGAGGEGPDAAPGPGPGTTTERRTS